MYSDGLIHDVAWFENVIAPVTVREDQYDQEFAKGLYEFAQPEIFSDTELITVRYKTPEGTLLWLDNIPVMRDGFGINSIINWYLATDKESVSLEEEGWTAFFQDINENKKYLWNYEAVKYTSNKLVKSTPRIIARWTTEGQAIKSITEYYLISDHQTGVTSTDSGWGETPITTTQDQPYLWNYELVGYTTGETTTTSPRIIGFYGQGVQGDKGDKGDKGGQYWGRNIPAEPVKGDTYLDVTAMYLMEYNGTTWTTVPYTDTRYTMAVQDIIGSATESAQLMQIANAWVANLVAGTVLANQLMAKNLTVLDGGSIQSENYSQGVSGWKINSDGFAEFENGLFRGQVNATSGTFNGTVNANAGEFNNVTINESCQINGVAIVNNTPFAPSASITASVDTYDGSISRMKSRNIQSVSYLRPGTFRLNFENPLSIKYYILEGKKYIDIFCNGYGSVYERGYMSMCIPITASYEDTLDNLFTIVGDKVNVTYVDIEFYWAGGGNKMTPSSIELFLFYTEI